MEDNTLLDGLREIDESEDIDVTQWEAEFLESILSEGFKTDLQRAVADRIIDTYL